MTTFEKVLLIATAIVLVFLLVYVTVNLVPDLNVKQNNYGHTP